ncbi:VOC family protein [Fulvivirga lutea]|uniref:VOC family protein n=1 Tax=Fulvivirga lutea TaxID=2810512 RepID=A0A975A0H1_9BACT|nr:VOC family protein [Fulvivirga lutea]QSE96417.1 VOC family protein [Fulvivirga lutea]
MAKGRVTGIGGIFFKSNEPKKLTNWYKEHLGLVTDEYGSMFEFRHANNPEKKGYLQWSAFSIDTKYMEPSNQPFMINYRVENIEALVKQLKNEGVNVVDEIASYDYGKFVHIMDPEGNKIELWEPVDEGFGDYSKNTTK